MKKVYILVASLVLLASCGKDSENAKIDDVTNDNLTCDFYEFEVESEPGTNEYAKEMLKAASIVVEGDYNFVAGMTLTTFNNVGDDINYQVTDYKSESCYQLTLLDVVEFDLSLLRVVEPSQETTVFAFNDYVEDAITADNEYQNYDELSSFDDESINDYITSFSSPGVFYDYDWLVGFLGDAEGIKNSDGSYAYNFEMENSSSDDTYDATLIIYEADDYINVTIATNHYNVYVEIEFDRSLDITDAYLELIEIYKESIEGE